jgi:hypothetical protein
MPGARDIVEVKEESWLSIILGWGKGVVAFALMATAIIALLYSGLAATLMIFSPTSPDSTERSWVIRNAWTETGNRPPVGEEVVISTTSYMPSEFWNLILTGWKGIPDPAVVKIHSDDFDKLYIEKGTVSLYSDPDTVFEEYVGSPAAKYDVEKETGPSTFQIDGQFLVECISGGCEKGTYFVIDRDQIYGKEQG